MNRKNLAKFRLCLIKELIFEKIGLKIQHKKNKKYSLKEKR
ncbi:hypothetical protein L289_3860 [Acinetobacter gerneri DSM 14967 = CIP 107464 = MTCC 9824]|uniref:Uncharacterized protein n=1 Tax=Acinetobacter gerneri DSM 14967 = CIP 107464 = MTCC 9824 TaxID=1120926 RepID=N8YF48_9GAMM|nr:hypothetical protein F960_00584 [Acinetobacter gerneri DSM 14967 = CIP 107464 = MTCC 9824]EPR81251.1 hypothetical protein L289_3860 [Acinetobacter gerneri DSM 14967 = CIP 107464 = MTCC 9824]